MTSILKVNEIDTYDNTASISIKHDGTTAITIDSSQNVGIGTTTPGYPLDVAGQIRGTLLRAESDLNIPLQVYSTDAYCSASLSDSNGSIKLESQNSSLKFYVGGDANSSGANSTETMRIDSSGNVGIGTSSPNERLSVVAEDDSSAIDNGFAIYRSVGDDKVNINAQGGAAKFIADGGSSYIPYRFFGYDGTTLAERLTIDGSGNVGIGTTSPSTQLEVDGKVTADNVNSAILTVAIGKFNSDGTTSKASGISCSRTATGEYTISFSTARPDANYTILSTVIETSANLDDVTCHVIDGTQATTGFNVKIHEGDNGTTAGVLVDRNFYIVVYDVV